MDGASREDVSTLRLIEPDGLTSALWTCMAGALEGGQLELGDGDGPVAPRN